MIKKINQIRVNKAHKEMIRVTLNRDLNYKFTYYQPIDSIYAYFTFKDVKTKNKAYKDLMMWYSGNYMSKFRKTIKK